MKFIPLAALVVAAALVAPPTAPLSASRSAPQSSPSSPTVYLSDFELHAVLPQRNRSAPNASPSSQPAADEPATRAGKLVTFLTLSIGQALISAGYNVERYPPASGPPDHGLLIRGVFTEPDEYNRVRRAIYGSGSKSPRFVVYAGVADLGKADQPLYELVPPNTPGFPANASYGPLITITTYSPVSSFVLDKQPADDDVRRAAADLVKRFETLLDANPWSKR